MSHQGNYDAFVGPAVAVAVASDLDVFYVLGDNDTLQLGGDFVGADAGFWDFGGGELYVVGREYRDGVHHVF